MPDNQTSKIFHLLSDIDLRIQGLERMMNHCIATVGAAIPRTRKSLAPVDLKLTPEETERQRHEKVLTTFATVVNSDREKRKRDFPSYLIEPEKDKEPFGAIPFSALVNRLYGLAVFKTVPKYGETTAFDNAQRAVEKSGLPICTVSELCLAKPGGYIESKARVVLTEKAAHRYLGFGGSVRVFSTETEETNHKECEVCGIYLNEDGSCSVCEAQAKEKVKEKPEPEKASPGQWTPSWKKSVKAEPEPETNTDCPACGGHVEDGYCFDCEWNSHGDKCAKHGTALKDGDCPECEREEDEARDGGLL